MLNVVALQGRLVRDIELRTTSGGKSVGSFTLAVDDDFQNSDGNRNTNFVNCTVWGKTAEFAEKYFHKGDMAIVNGRLSVRNYEDKDGNKRTATDVVINNINFGGSKKKSDSDDSGLSYPEANFADAGDEDGALPF